MNEILMDNLSVSEVIKGNFEQVHRVIGQTSIYNLEVILDYHAGLFPMKKDGNYSFSMMQDGVNAKQFYDKNTSKKAQFEGWEYIVFGTIFESRESGAGHM